MDTETKKKNFMTRDALMKLLSEDEMSRLSTGEAGAALAVGEEFIDLEQLRAGVQLVQEPDATRLGHVITKSAVAPETWLKLCARLEEGNAR